jgi:ubiquinone/menaquinone biosynthesis C-methylase UbiE
MDALGSAVEWRFSLKLPSNDNLERLRTEYAAIDRRLAGSNLYSPFNAAYLFTVQQRQRAVLKLLAGHGFNPLTNRRILELGCDRGGTLLEWLGYGATPKRLHGTDLLPDRVRGAHTRLPHLPLTCADGQHLPYQTGVFDLALQYTVVSSILDDAIKANLARELLRVIKSDGLILWYDFWLNPTNQQTRGVRRVEIRRLFPRCRFEFHRITLAPPICRRLAPVSWLLAYLLEKMKLFNTHYLVAIRKQAGP